MDKTTGLVGRDTELAAVAELLDGPGGGALVVFGPAGSGKTALLDAASDRALSRGGRVLRATGYRSESRHPYAGLHQLLFPVLDGVANTDEALVRLFAGADPAEAGRACRRLLRDVTGSRRTLVIVDDCQWLDGESTHALGVVCRQLTAGDADLVIASRHCPAPEVLGAGTREVELTPLSSQDAGALVRRTASTLHGYTRDTVIRGAEGNPQALIEFARAVEAGGHGRLGLSDDAPLPVSDQLGAFYDGWIRRLPAPTRRALLLAAAAGTEETAMVLASGLVECDARDWAPAEAAGLIVMDGPDLSAATPRFVNPLMRSAVYGAATHAQRQDAHRVIAAALASAPGRRVWHLAQSAWHPDEEIATLLQETAAQLAARGGFYPAATAMERAARLSPDPRDACRRLGRAAEFAGEAQERTWMVELAERAMAFGTEAGMEPEELLEARQFIAQGKVYLGSDPDLVHDLLTWLASAVGHPCFETVALLSFAATAAYYAPDPRQIAELRRLADRLPDPLAHPELWDEPRTAAAALLYVRYATAPFLPRDEPLDPRAVLEESSAEDHRIAGYGMIAAAAHVLDQPEVAEEAMRTANERRRSDGVSITNPAVLAMNASNNEMWGRWREAADQAREVIELSTETGEGFNLALGHITAGLVAVRQGRTEPARHHARAADRAGDGVSRSVPTRTRHLHGLISLTEGDYDTAYTLLRSTLLTDERVPVHFHLSHYAVADFALCGLLTHQREDAAAVLDGIRAHADGMTPGGAAHLSRRLRLLHDLARALVAEPEDAEALFLSALAPGAERWPFDEARVRLHYGEHLRRQRRIVKARALLRAALETFRALEALPWAHRAETELRAAGAHAEEPARSAAEPSSGAFAVLTPQQRAVAAFAAGGLTNPQIAARLNISPKTVGNHLSRIFAKLEITGRARLHDLQVNGLMGKANAEMPGLEEPGRAEGPRYAERRGDSGQR